MIITMVPYEFVDHAWGDAGPLLERAVKTSRGKYTLDDVKQKIDTGEYALWVVIDGTTVVAAFTTRIAKYADSLALCLDWMGGSKMAQWMDDGMDVMIDYAKKYGCTRIEGRGRPAWGRFLARLGWQQDYIAYRKDIV